jgi:hypothetical protein
MSISNFSVTSQLPTEALKGVELITASLCFIYRYSDRKVRTRVLLGKVPLHQTFHKSLSEAVRSPTIPVIVGGEENGSRIARFGAQYHPSHRRVAAMERAAPSV